jgi:sphinganine-1-phosphate aldolase
MALPRHGRNPDDLLAELAAMQADDVRWRDGRTFGLVYDGGPTVHAVAEAAAAQYLHENALNTIAVPSLARIQREVVDAMADLLHGDSAAGFMTSGGTESIMVAVLGARERCRAERGVERGELLLADSAHAAFHKAAHVLGLDPVVVPVGPDGRADVAATAAAVTERTVLVVASAPGYPHGVIDPVPELAAVAAAAGANCHVDACMGGFVLPFLELDGEEVRPWDLRVPGVTSISLDVHKLGYAPKGASVVLWRDKALRRWQTFSFDDWLGGFYASPNLQGSRSGAPMAAAWAVVQHLGVDGYVALTRRTIDTTRRMIAAVRAVDGLDVIGEPDAHLFAIRTAPGWEDRMDVFAVGDAMAARGWYHDRLHRPDALHLTVSAGNAPVVDAWVDDLAEAAATVHGTRASDRSTTYATLE